MLRIVLALALFVATGMRFAVAAPAAIVSPGDRIHVAVAGEADVSQDVVVASDGTIGLPLAGQIRIGGKSPVAAGVAIEAALKPFMRDPHVTIDIANEGQIAVTVLGDVVNSGLYQLRPGATLSAAITAAGGMAPDIKGTYPVARIANADGTTYHISLDKLLREGDPTRDVGLRDGSAVYVPGPVVYDVVVLGAVDKPGTIGISAGDKLSIAIAKAGTTTNANADLTRISVSRTEPDGTRAAHPVNLYEALEKGDARFDPALRAGDIIYVPAARQSHGNLTNAVFLLSRLFLL